MARQTAVCWRAIAGPRPFQTRNADNHTDLFFLRQALVEDFFAQVHWFSLQTVS